MVPDEEMVSEGVVQALEEAAAEKTDPEPAPQSDGDAPVAAGRLRTPRRWESLLVDASVIGGLDRWSRRLAGLAWQR